MFNKCKTETIRFQELEGNNILIDLLLDARDVDDRGQPQERIVVAPARLVYSQ